MSKTIDVLILTEARYEHPQEVNWYVQNILTEDGLVQTALEKRGCRVERVDWNRDDVDWASAKCALFRTTWDYFDKYPVFRAWLDRVEPVLPLINSAFLARWNTDKHYLQDLEKAGIHIAPTLFVELGDTRSLEDLHTETGWEHTVLKPVVSGAGRHTYQLKAGDWSKYEAVYRDLIREEAMMLQPFQHDVVRTGELALMVVNGAVTHAVKKVAKPGDFRVQDDFGGTVHGHVPTAEEVRFAEAAVRACPEEPLYARVDIIRDNAGALAVAELELIEPEMWFREYPPAADLLAEAIVEKLRG